MRSVLGGFAVVENRTKLRSVLKRMSLGAHGDKAMAREVYLEGLESYRRQREPLPAGDRPMIFRSYYEPRVTSSSRARVVLLKAGAARMDAYREYLMSRLRSTSATSSALSVVVSRYS